MVNFLSDRTNSCGIAVPCAHNEMSRKRRMRATRREGISVSLPFVSKVWRTQYGNIEFLLPKSSRLCFSHLRCVRDNGKHKLRARLWYIVMLGATNFLLHGLPRSSFYYGKPPPPRHGKASKVSFRRTQSGLNTLGKLIAGILRRQPSNVAESIC
jgi:hypothetical protein